MTDLLYGADSIDPTALPGGVQWVAGYVGGRWPDYSSLVSIYPQLAAVNRVVPIAVNASESARILDVENGDATPVEAGPWLSRMLAAGVELPGIYADASTMPAVIANLNATGIDRSKVVLWVADWDGNATITPPYQAKQYASNPGGKNYDADVALSSFFPGGEQPAHKNETHYGWFDGTTRGLFGRRSERAIVMAYDKYRKRMTSTHKPPFARLRLYLLRILCRQAADRIYTVAHQFSTGKRPAWGKSHRGWRYQQLCARARGERVV